jgi:hypothetical protein
MPSVHDTLLELLVSERVLRVRDVVRASGASRQAALEGLRRLVVSGELVVRGVGRGTCYVRGAGTPTGEHGAVRGAQPGSVWVALAAALPSFAYVALGRAQAGTCRTRAQARALLRNLGAVRHVVLDFEGVERAGDAFLGELLGEPREWQLLQPINLRPAVASSLERVQRLWRHKPRSDRGT